MTIKLFQPSSPEQSQPDRKVSVPWVFSLVPGCCGPHAVGEMASRELMDDCLMLGDLATFSVDRDEDAPSLPSPASGGGLGWGQRIGQQRMQLLFAAAAGVAGLAPLLKRVWMGGLR